MSEPESHFKNIVNIFNGLEINKYSKMLKVDRFKIAVCDRYPDTWHPLNNGYWVICKRKDGMMEFKCLN